MESDIKTAFGVMTTYCQHVCSACNASSECVCCAEIHKVAVFMPFLLPLISAVTGTFFRVRSSAKNNVDPSMQCVRASENCT